MADSNKDAREKEARRELSLQPDFMNDDGSVSDVAARNRLKRQAERAKGSPLMTPAEEGSRHTPQAYEEDSDAHLHSDGGVTLAPEANSVRELAGVSAEDVKEQDKAVEDGVKRAEKERDERRKEQEDKRKNAKKDDKK